MTHQERITMLETMHAQLCELRDAYSEPTATLASRACKAVKALRQAMQIAHKERPKRTARRKRGATDHARRCALHERLLERMASLED
ncbi:hypothetical protein FBQ95_16970 [Chloroflexi bacterium CFX3]|nr:hypothetical protein [Chloroflexi bacterium CFX3]